MSAIKDLTILAVTKMHGGVCVAGIDQFGAWVRPVRLASERPRYTNVVTDYCLLPIDFFHEGKSHLLNLGVTRFYLDAHTPQPPHNEDWTLNLSNKPRLIKKLSTPEQAKFLQARAETDLPALLACGNRSLGLFQTERFRFSFAMNQTGDDVTARASFTVGKLEIEDIGCTDLRMRALGRRLLEKSQGKPRSLSEEDFKRHGKQAVFLALGLSRLYQGKHWLLLVGVHCLPELEVEVNYARL